MESEERIHNFAVECLLEAIREAGLYCGERGIRPSYEESFKLVEAIKERFNANWKNDMTQAVSRSLLAEARKFGVEAVDSIWPKARLN
jgi:hypothetical protein